MIRYNPISDTPISYIAHEKIMQLVSELRHVSYLTCLLERDFGILENYLYQDRYLISIDFWEKWSFGILEKWSKFHLGGDSCRSLSRSSIPGLSWSVATPWRTKSWAGRSAIRRCSATVKNGEKMWKMDWMPSQGTKITMENGPFVDEYYLYIETKSWFFFVQVLNYTSAVRWITW